MTGDECRLARNRVRFDFFVTSSGFMDDDTLLIRLLDGDAPLSQEEAEARLPYERLLARIKALPDIEPRTGWETRAIERWRREQKRPERSASPVICLRRSTSSSSRCTTGPTLAARAAAICTDGSPASRSASGGSTRSHDSAAGPASVT